VGSRAVDEKLITAEELAKVKGRCELVEGRVVRLSPAGFLHGLVAANIHDLLVAHVRRKKAGRVLSADTGYRVRRNPDTVRAPDVAFVSNETLAAHEDSRETFFPTAPDLAVEVLSPDDSWVAVDKKAREYLAAGAKIVWVVNPEVQEVRLYDGAAPRILTAKDKIDGGKALPGFKTPVKAFFAR